MRPLTSIFLILLLALTYCHSSGPPNPEDEALLDHIQRLIFLYFWDGSEPNSGAARERILMDDGSADPYTVTTNGPGNQGRINKAEIFFSIILPCPFYYFFYVKKVPAFHTYQICAGSKKGNIHDLPCFIRFLF